jgi:orotidine-5'-phosphate decarboxylase
MAALVDKENLGRALVGLCYTSNPDARQVQDLWVPGATTDGAYLWEYFAEWILQWAEELGVVENAGLVMAAAYRTKKDAREIYSRHLTRCREIVGNKLWFLIPGIGAQGGFIKETVRTAYVGPGSIAINSSSEIDFASAGPDFAEAAAKKAMELRDAINKCLGNP